MKANKSILAIIVTVSFASNASADSFNGMTKADKAAATNTSLSAFNTASRAAAAQTSGTGGAVAASQARTAAITADHNAKIGAQLTKANQTRTQQQVDANAAAAVAAANATPTTPVGTSLKNISLAKTAAAAQTPANSSINMAVSSIPASTPVTATINGKVTQTTAGVLAQIAPQTQVAMPMVSAFSPTPRKGDHNRGTHSRGERGTGNGANNAQNSRSAGGLADSHVGGGRSGGGFHY